MLEPGTIFSVGNTAALCAWVTLGVGIFHAGFRSAALRVSGVFVPGLLGLSYVVLIISGRAAFETGGFGSVAAVRALFQNDAIVTAGWFHYLAFDLLVGTAIVKHGIERCIPGLALLPSLALTFLFGPIGWLVSIAVARAFGRSSIEGGK